MKEKKKETTTRQEILEAARDIFHRKGLSGARMQEIADAVHINKAMLHYYFKTKEQLFDAVFREAFGKLAPQIMLVLNADLPLKEKIQQFTERYLTVLSENPFIPVFVLNELNQNPKRLVSLMRGTAKPGLEKFLMQIEKEVKAKKIRAIKPHQLMVNLLSMCVFPFVGKPMMMGILNMNEKSFQQFIEERKKEIPEFIFSSVKL